jgi:hypothetical protein
MSARRPASGPDVSAILPAARRQPVKDISPEVTDKAFGESRLRTFSGASPALNTVHCYAETARQLLGRDIGVGVARLIGHSSLLD